ncbi:MAG: ROK family protein [Clostridiales bacterium]|nr:ROK family protein [Clostridiales bacterium]
MGNILALDIGGSKLLCGIVSESGEILAKALAEFPDGYGLSELKTAVLKTALPLAKAFSPDRAGAAIPGLCDPKRGLWVYAPKTGIRDFDIKSFVSEEFRLPLYIENDVNACAVGEKRFGVCRGVDDYLWVTVSTGIGGSIFSGGKLLTGSCGNAGEIGHVKVVPSGRKCGCGGLGCLEAEASGSAIAAKYLERTGKKLSAKQIAGLAKNGDGESAGLYREAGYLIGTALACAANLLNPECAVLGGGVAMDFPLLLPGIQSALGSGLFSAANPRFSVIQTGLGYDAALLGAAALAL